MDPDKGWREKGAFRRGSQPAGRQITQFGEWLSVTLGGTVATTELTMSNTSKTRTRRLNRRKQAGKTRKKIQAKGTTPKFPIHPDGKGAEPRPPERNPDAITGSN